MMIEHGAPLRPTSRSWSIPSPYSELPRFLRRTTHKTRIAASIAIKPANEPAITGTGVATCLIGIVWLVVSGSAKAVGSNVNDGKGAEGVMMTAGEKDEDGVVAPECEKAKDELLSGVDVRPVDL